MVTDWIEKLRNWKIFAAIFVLSQVVFFHLSLWGVVEYNFPLFLLVFGVAVLFVFVRRSRGYLLLGDTSLVSIAAVLLIIEFGFRQLYPALGFQTQWTSKFDPEVGFIHEPNVQVKWTNYLDFSAVARANSLGFLDTEPSPAGKGGCRIAFIGDSFVEAAQVEIKDKVQRLLENEAEARLEAINGWHPDHAPRIFARKTAHGFALVDIAPSWQQHQLKQPLSELPPWHRWLKYHSSFYRYLWFSLSAKYPDVQKLEGVPYAEKIKLYAAELKADPAVTSRMAGWSNEFAQDLDGRFEGGHQPPLYQDAVEYTRFALAEFKRRTKADGANLVILSASQMGLITGTGNNHSLGLLKGIAESLDIPLRDQFGYIQEIGGDPALAQFAHDGHWTKQAHQGLRTKCWITQILRKSAVDAFSFEAGKIRSGHLNTNTKGRYSI